MQNVRQGEQFNWNTLFMDFSKFNKKHSATKFFSGQNHHNKILWTPVNLLFEK